MTKLSQYDKRKARMAVHLALVDGKLVKPKRCEGCNKKRGLCAHHPDYDKPLEVKWLCDSCHNKAHGWKSGMKHGTLSRYVNKRCRCEKCRRANTENQRRRRAMAVDRVKRRVVAEMLSFTNVLLVHCVMELDRTSRLHKDGLTEKEREYLKKQQDSLDEVVKNIHKLWERTNKYQSHV